MNSLTRAVARDGGKYSKEYADRLRALLALARRSVKKTQKGWTAEERGFQASVAALQTAMGFGDDPTASA